LKVLFITCDGASPNRRFFKLHQLPQQINDSTVYCTDNPFAVGENRYLFFISVQVEIVSLLQFHAQTKQEHTLLILEVFVRPYFVPYLTFVNLPSTRTLYDYSHCIKSGTGFRAEITNQLITEIHSKRFTDNWQQYVGLLHDEIIIYQLKYLL
jgi:hypothetical protein